MKFSDFIDLIAREYSFSNIAFENSGVFNSKDENQGSAKVFCFGLMHSLSEREVIKCFGEHYQSVLDSPQDQSSHLNIRSFMNSGWEGVTIDFAALTIKENINDTSSFLRRK
jgi:HopJ type III effector protein.